MPTAQLKIAVTGRCTNDCAICFNDTRRADNSSREDLPSKLLEEVLSDGAAMGMAGVYWSGGEPTLRYRELVELTAHARALGLATSVVTNAAALGARGAYADKNEALLRQAGAWGESTRTLLETWQRAGLTRVFVSIDNSHNTLRGVDAAPANRVPTEVAGRVIRVLLELGFGVEHEKQSIGHRLRVSATASGAWVKGSRRVLDDVLARAGLRHESSARGGVEGGGVEWWGTEADAGRVLVKRLQTSKVGAALILPERLLERRRGAALEQIRCGNMRPRAQAHDGGAHHQDLSINHDGEVALCGNFMYPIGNIREERIGKIIARVNSGSDRGPHGSTVAVLHRLLRVAQRHGHGELAIGEAFRMLRASAPALVEGLSTEGGACTALGRNPRVQEAFVRAYDERYGSC
ncbi:Radical SAM domain protein [Enhygromyxa salina]|uniref:Radical SAM domain protein n=2 Tax=Enhygromyxa salina TaxID=215803 RepID=A0A0C2D3N6_9BACT|nr:Radical SAM domain protein [Enhygromyxa salina]